jgi:hypothetical protein
VKWKHVALAGLLAAGLGVALLARSLHQPDPGAYLTANNAFVPIRLPSATTQELMDIGIADVNGDDVLDIFTSNHNFRQNLWVADGKGGYRDLLSAWGLDQYLGFPGLEISRTEPEMTDPGVYIYWKGRKTLAIRTHKLEDIGRLRGRLRTYSTVNGFRGSGIAARSEQVVPGSGEGMPETVVEFAADADGALAVEIESPGIPIRVELMESPPLASVFVGGQKVVPRAAQFELRFQDRHGMAWVDYNNDGRMDVFISRGAIGGTLKSLPEGVSSTIADELFASQGGEGRFRESSSTVGIEKRGCSGRKVSWVDFDKDGLVDLFINCQDRGNVDGRYPKQLYRQDRTGMFVDVAAEVGLDLPEHEIVDFIWFDADNDGYVDLITSEDKGFFIYRNRRGNSFTRELIGRGKFVRGDNPNLRGIAEEYWFVDGKLVVADFDGDGDLDVFSASKKGNALLINDGSGRFALADPATRGLPGESATASWVDFDNDGLVDLHVVPQGLFRQRPDHSFEATGLLTLPPQRYMAAIASWPDLDNDGRRDALLALDENFSLWNWWQKLTKANEDRWTWHVLALRNAVAGGHWLQVRLAGRPGNAQAIGAQVTLRTADGQQTQVVGLNDGAFFSQGHYRLYFGLGSHARADTMRIRWPDGTVQELRNVEGDRLHVIAQPEPESQGVAK